MKKLLFSVLVLQALAVPALAADPVDPSFDWSGAYLGVQGGYAFGEANHNFYRGAPTPLDPTQQDSSPKGMFGGLHLGFNHQMNNVLLGLEADAELAGIDGSYNDPGPPGSSGSTEIDWQGSVRARIGMPMDRLLPYLTGGLALASADFTGGPPLNPCCGYSETLVGYTLGAGLEYAVTDSVTARIEYRFSDFGEVRGNLLPSQAAVTMPVDVEVHAIRVGLSWHF